MSLTNTRSAGILLFGLAIWAGGHSVRAETWKAASETSKAATVDNGSSASLNWQQRVLKRPVTPQEPAVSQSAGSRPANSSYRSARRSSYDLGPFDTAQMTRDPAYSNRHRARLVGNEEPEMIPPGETQYEPIAEQGVFAGEDRGGCGDCGPCGGSTCGECCDFGYEVFDGRCDWWIRNLTLFVGGQGFKGPVDWGTNGNYGINEGLGVSGPLGDPWGCGYQMGARFVQSNFSGLQAAAPGTDRTQYFVTAGIFRRELCRGLQWGVVWDYMHDRYYDTFKLNQLRSDIGFVIDEVHEVGFLGAFGVSTDTYNYGNFRNINLDPTDMFALYFRRNFENGGDGRIWGGGTGRGDGLVGADLWVPLGRGFALQNIINYKIPREGRAGGVAHADESWGLTIQLVWYPGQSALCQRGNPYRPMHNVADNSLFMVDQIIR
ncbi:MAG: hypothetical protein KKE86_12635 [Planctomycetes bacterium]|nr:hypothetical protein [Planctomycetota bacterium]MBU4400168.1 hypothetical protein [Planctomycetota bacterium]MCG2682638.1 hypothetical protein [Planctomycetales bacterium]